MDNIGSLTLVRLDLLPLKIGAAVATPLSGDVTRPAIAGHSPQPGTERVEVGKLEGKRLP